MNRENGAKLDAAGQDALKALDAAGGLPLLVLSKPLYQSVTCHSAAVYVEKGSRYWLRWRFLDLGGVVTATSVSAP